MSNSADFKRYIRQTTLPEVGLEGQKKLQAAKVLCVGAGGLGAPVMQYLVAAGVGTLGIIDFDTVALSNLHRQVLFAEKDIGQAKVMVAKEKLQLLNSDCTINCYQQRLTTDNVEALFSQYDFIVDCADNFSTHYLCNDYAYLHNKPCAMASVEKFKGFVISFFGQKGPCYRCLFPVPPKGDAIPTCNEAGILGVMPGLFGLLEANEILKMILQLADKNISALLQFDALSNQFDSFKLEQDEHCKLCGQQKSIQTLLPYCEEITTQALQEAIQNNDILQIIDVREKGEKPDNPYPAMLYPLKDLEQRLVELKPNVKTVVICRTGKRSASAVEILKSAGFKQVSSLVGGLKADF